MLLQSTFFKIPVNPLMPRTWTWKIWHHDRERRDFTKFGIRNDFLTDDVEFRAAGVGGHEKEQRLVNPKINFLVSLYQWECVNPGLFQSNSTAGKPVDRPKISTLIWKNESCQTFAVDGPIKKSTDPKPPISHCTRLGFNQTKKKAARICWGNSAEAVFISSFLFSLFF